MAQDLGNDVNFSAREVDFNTIIKDNVITKGAQGILSGTLATLGNVKNDGTKLLDLLQQIDPCNASGAIAAALNALKAAQNLIQALQTAIASASFDILGALMGAAAEALKNLEASLASALFGALSSSFCGPGCGPTGGTGGSPLDALAKLANLDLASLAGLGSIQSIIGYLGDEAARIRSGGALTNLDKICLSKLVNDILGNFNLCGLLQSLISMLIGMIPMPSELGKPGPGSFSFMMKILDMLEALFGGLQAASSLLRALGALDRALACSGYNTGNVNNFPIRDYPPNFKIGNQDIKGPYGGPGGDGGDVGGRGGLDILKFANNKVIVPDHQKRIEYANTKSGIPTHIPRNNDLVDTNIPKIPNKVRVGSLSRSNLGDGYQVNVASDGVVSITMASAPNTIGSSANQIASDGYKNLLGASVNNISSATVSLDTITSKSNYVVITTPESYTNTGDTLLSISEVKKTAHTVSQTRSHIKMPIHIPRKNEYDK